MFGGPVFQRELASVPRSWRLYFLRALDVGALFGLVATAWLILFGSQPVRSLGSLARFGSACFALIAPVQLALAVAFSALLAAAAVAQEKDRRTLDLLLMTRLTNSELVIGRLLASLLSIMVVVLAGAPLLMLLALLGGVSHVQIARVCGVTLVAAIAAGSIGSTLALWREKTFQTLALTALALGLWLLAGEAVAAGALGNGWLGASAVQWAAATTPLRALFAATQAAVAVESMLPEYPALGGPATLFMLVAAALAVLLNLWAIARVRVWNPSREARAPSFDERRDAEEHARAAARRASGDVAAVQAVHAAPGRAREVWDNPILWREICTWAYGKKVVVVRLAYSAVVAACATAVWRQASIDPSFLPQGAIPPAAKPFLPLFILGLLLVNALAVTSLTNERDGGALDLLLVTDLTPKEIIFGKVGGAFYNGKEMILLPGLVCLGLWLGDRISTENLVFLAACLMVANAFVIMLGLHAGMTYSNSRSAVAVSVGTLLFLLLGIAVCMRLMMAFQTSFNYQLQAFAAFMLGGGIGLYCALGIRNPSPAIQLATLPAPFVTYFAITSFLRGQYGSAALVAVAMYGFATMAMLIPAIAEFDVATGRTTARDL